MPELPEVETIRRHLAPHVEGRTLRGGRDPRRPLVPAARAGRARATRCAGRRVERLGAARQVPRLGARGRRLPAHAPAHDRDAAARPGRRRRAHTRVRFDARRAHGSSSTTRAASAPASSRSARTRSTRSSTRGSASSRSSATSPASTCTRSRATSRAPIKAFLLDQKRDRRRRQHLRRRGAVPRARPPAAAREPAHARAVRGAPRRASSSR